MVWLGAHVSAAGGVSRAATAAAKLGCEAVQVFLRPPGQWASPPRTEEEIGRCRALLATPPLSGRCFAHAPYLLNLASDNAALARRSVLVLAEELQLADRMGLAGVVLHPGSAGTGERPGAIARCRAALAAAVALAGHGSAAIFLENTAGGGGQLGRSVCELAGLIPGGEAATRRYFGLCLDLAHLWAVGYDLSAEGWEVAVGEVRQGWGIPVPHVIHGNDTSIERGSRKDRHAPPGEGVLGEELFRRLLNDERLADTPFILEISPGRNHQLVASALQRLRAWRNPAAW